MSDIKKSDQEPLLLEHDYDGIRELDNPLPGWWQITFYATIIFSFIYFIHYHTGTGPHLSDELKEDMAKIELLQKQRQSKPAPEGETESLATLVADANSLQAGQAEYTSKCAACHGNSGEGLIGPNLVDRNWKNGDGTVSSILHLIEVGIPDKGMPGWKNVIPDEKLRKVAAYVRSLRGASVTGGRPPEGKEVSGDEI